MENKHSIMIIDEDKSQVITLQRLIANSFPDTKIFTALDGNSAFNNILQNKIQILLTGLHLPALDGIELIKKIKENEELQDVFIIVMSSNSEIAIRNLALDKGADDFINKPVFSDQLNSKIKTALKIADLNNTIHSQNNLMIELANELESEIQDMIKLSVNMLQARIPGSSEYLKRVANAAVWIAKEYKNFDMDLIRDLEIAAFLSIIGRLYLPDDLLRMPVLDNGMPTLPILSQVPLNGSELVGRIQRFKDVSLIIRHIYENFDGSGVPDKFQSWQIPFSSRIIRVALDYEEVKMQKNLKPREVMELIMKESQRLYDHRVCVLMDHYIKSHEKEEYDPTEQAVQLSELKEGMILTRDIITDRGQKLLPAGAVLRLGAIEKIISHNSTDHILGHIHIRKI